MALLPAPRSATVEAIYSWWANRQGRLSRRLGASQIGQECERRLWYGFRWASGAESFDGRVKRLFNRGHREEAVFVEELRGIGCDVRDIDPATGEQFTFTACGGHVVAKIDGVVKGVPEAPKTWHVLGCKTINAKGHAELMKKGVAEAKPEHVDQNQLEMHLSQLDRTLYISACKDDDQLYADRLRYDASHAERLVAKAERVVFAPEPLPGISADPAFYKCKQCPAAAVCHTERLPAVSCRTCLHATPERDGDGRWSCAKWKSDIPLDAQAAGCGHHLYIPALLARWGEAEDAHDPTNPADVQARPDEPDAWVAYKAPDGFEFRNGPWGLGSFTSKELAASTPALLRSEEFQAIRARYAGTITDEVVPDQEAA